MHCNDPYNYGITTCLIQTFRCIVCFNAWVFLTGIGGVELIPRECNQLTTIWMFFFSMNAACSVTNVRCEKPQMLDQLVSDLPVWYCTGTCHGKLCYEVSHVGIWSEPSPSQCIYACHVTVHMVHQLRLAYSHFFSIC